MDNGGRDGCGITDSTYMSLSELPEVMMDREAWHATIHGVARSRTRLIDWIATMKMDLEVQFYYSLRMEYYEHAHDTWFHLFVPFSPAFL